MALRFAGISYEDATPLSAATAQMLENNIVTRYVYKRQ